MNDSRKVALDILIEYEKSGTYTNLALKKHLRDISNERDRKFITALVYGVIEKKLLLDYYISKVSSVKLRKINNVVINILRLGLYQIVFLSTPSNAACNTSVDLSKSNGQYKSAGFVNAILRKLSVSYKQIPLPDNDTYEYLSTVYSVSPENLKIFLNSFGKCGFVEYMQKGAAAKDKIYAAVNLRKTTADALTAMLSELGVQAQKTQFDSLISISSTVNIEKCPPFSQGLCHAIGLPSYLAALAVSPQNSSIVFDMCAAPGGKTLAMSYIASDNTEIYAFDVHSHKIDIIKESCRRCNVTNVNASVLDGTVLCDKYIGMADSVLCDVPCSGLGMIFKKPDIKYKKIDFDSLTDTQFKILSNASEYLKPGGRLVYSTCTVNPDENRGMIDRFLSTHSDFYIDTLYDIYDGRSGDATFMPCEDYSDGFYIAVLRKN